MDPRWRVREALAHELDLATGLAMSASFLDLFPSYGEAVRQLPEAWFQRGRALLGGLHGDLYEVLGRLAVVLELVEETDYAELTLRLRDVSAADLEVRARSLADRLGLSLPDGPEQALYTLSRALEGRVGFVPVGGGEYERRVRQECRLIVSICRDGPKHSSFWYWLDQFHHQVYRAWRLTRTGYLADERARAISHLGATEGRGVPPIGWLLPQNPLGAPGAARDAVLAGELSVVFHLEPFGLWDAIAALPGGVLVSLALPDALFTAFRERAADITSRLKAMADPTRLTMLRILRAYEVDNSEVASYLDLSQPTVSVHARVLREAGLVRSRRDGRRVLHRVDPDGVRRLLQELESFVGLRATPEEQPETTDPAASEEG